MEVKRRSSGQGYLEGKKAYVLMVYTELQTVSARYCYDEAHTYQQQWLQTS